MSIKPLNFDDWYGTPEIKSALSDIISEDNDQNPIIFVKSSRWDIELFKQENVENSQGALAKEFEQLFNLRKITDKDICYVRHIPKIEEGTLDSNGQPINPGHWVTLYFFKDHSDKNSLLFINPGSEKATTVGDVLGTIQPFFQKNDTNLYIYGSNVQDDMGSCGSVSAEFARALCSINNEEKKRFVQSLKEAKLCDPSPHKFIAGLQGNDKEYEIKYQTVNLDFLLSKTIKEDFKNDETTKSGYKGKKCRDAHSFAANFISEKDEDFTKLLTGDEESKNFILNLVNKNSENKTAKVEDILCPVLSSSIISGMNLLTPIQIQQVQQKRKELFGLKDKKTVRFTEILNQDEQKSHKSNTCLAAAGVASVFGIIFFAFLLSTSNTDIGKEINIPGLVISSIILVCTISIACLKKSMEQKVKPDNDLEAANVLSKINGQGYNSIS